MKSAFLLIAIPLLLISCDDLVYELPMTSNSGLAFLASREVAIRVDSSLTRMENTLGDVTSNEDSTVEASTDCPTVPLSNSLEARP